MPFVSTTMTVGDRTITSSFDAGANRYNLTIDENSQAGSVIGQIRFDGGGPGTTYFTILGADAAKVRIDDDGVIRLANGVTLDHEGADGVQSLAIEISALFFGDDGTVDSGDTSGTVVAVSDIDEGPTLTANLAAASFAEHSPAGTVIATFSGADEDGDTVTYDLTGTYADLFQIVGSEVRLKEAGKFDFETLGASIDLTLTARSTGSSGVEKTAEQTLRVNITDVNEPVSFDAVTPIDLAENSPAGTAVGQVTARDGDGDPVSYSLANHTDKFAIDSATGAISVRDGAVLDYEAYKDGAITLIVNAVSNGPDGRSSNASQDVTVQLGNVNEDIAWGQTPQTFTIDENSPAGTAIGTVTATDGDGTPVTYRLYGGGDENFTIDETTGAITVAPRAKLDFETQSEYVLKVRAESPFEGGLPTIRTQVVRIKLNDVNEPIIFDAVTPFELAENSAAGTPVGTVTARDGDGDPVTYSLSNHNDKFAIDAGTGAIGVKDGAVLNHETDAEITLTVNAVSNGPNGRTSTASQDVTIQVTDQPEPPELTVTPVAMPVDEHAAKDTVVARFAARDPDGDPVRVFVTGEHAGLFTIVGTDLVVADPDGLDFETLGDSIDVTLTTSSRAAGARPLLDRETFTLRLNDIDEAPAFGQESYSLTAQENTAPGKSLGIVKAVDPDRDGTVTYTLTGTHAAMFEINDRHELVLKADAVLDYEALAETNGLITLNATATSSRNGRDQSDTAEIRLQVRDVDEAPVFRDAADRPITTQTVRVDENDTGAVLTRLNAVDPDGDAPVRYFVTSQRDKFMLLDGQLRLKPGVALDYEALTDGRITVQVSAVSRQAGERPKVTKMDVTVEVGQVGNRGAEDLFSLAVAHDQISQQDLPAILARATRVKGFEGNLDKLRFADGVTEIWYRQINDPTATGGKSTLITAFNGTTETEVHYAVLTGYAGAVTAAHLNHADILVRNSTVGRNEHVGSQEILRGNFGPDHIDGGDGNDWMNGSGGDDRLYGGAGGDVLHGGSGRDILSGGEGRDSFFVDDTATSLNRADVITDFTQGEDKITINDRYLYWYQKIDRNDDGVHDATVLYDNPSGYGGIYALLRGFTSTLTKEDFERFVLFLRPVADVVKPDEDPLGNPTTGFVRQEKLLDVGRFKSVWYRAEEGDTRIYSSPDAGADSLVAVLQGYTGPLNSDVFRYWDAVMVEEVPDESAAADPAMALFAAAAKIANFTSATRLSVPDGSNEVWVRRVGQDTLLTWFNADPDGDGVITGFTVLTDYGWAVASENLNNANILIRSSRVGRDDNEGLVEFMRGFYKADHLDGGEGNDILNGNRGDDRLYGGEGHDKLYGGKNDDRLYGGDGNDLLDGGSGRDILTGGAGRDRFGVQDTAASLDRADVVTDFTKGEDKIDIGSDFVSVRAVKRKQVWMKRVDADSDGSNDDTVLYNNAGGRADFGPNGGIIAILQDFDGALDESDFVTYLGNAIRGFEVEVI